MLDDLKYIHERDADDALGIALKQAQQLRIDYDLPNFDFAGKIENVVYSGMGGSALAALLSTTWPGYKLPFIINRDYSVPAFVSDKTLFIASSYSGNTEETIQSIEHAKQQGAHIVVTTSGGKLAEIAQQNNYPLALIPASLQPRHAVLYGFKALLQILAQADLIDAEKVMPELEKAADFLEDSLSAWRADIAVSQNPAKQLAQELAGRSVVIYGGPLMFPAAYKWKISFNENAKNIAWCNQLSEFNHNEMLGWTSHPTDKPYAVINLRSQFEDSRIQKRFEVTERLLSGKKPAAFNIEAHGETLLEQLLWQVAFGDFVSLYLALINGLNPTPVELIEKFKLELGS